MDMETTGLLAGASVLLAVLGAVATLVRSALQIVGEEGLSGMAGAGVDEARTLLAAVRDPFLGHPFSLWATGVALKFASAVLMGAAALLLASRGPAGAGPLLAAVGIACYGALLFSLETIAPRFAMRDPGGLLRRAGGPCLFLLKAAALPGRAFRALGRLLVGGDFDPEGLMDVRFGSEEGILDVVEEGAEHGTIDPVEERMIEGVLSLGRSAVSEGMTPWGSVVALREGMPRDAVADAVAEAGHSRYPVLSANGEEVIGILSSRALLRPASGERWTSSLEKPVYVPASMRTSDLFRLFRRSRGHLAVVIDEHGKICGIVTVHDLLEKIVGRMTDGPGTEDLPEWEKDGALSVPAGTPVRLLREEYGVEIPLSPYYETAGGFAMDALQAVPEGTETFHAHGYRITIAETERYRIRRLRFEKVPGSPTGTS